MKIIDTIIANSNYSRTELYNLVRFWSLGDDYFVKSGDLKGDLYDHTKHRKGVVDTIKPHECYDLFYENNPRNLTTIIVKLRKFKSSKFDKFDFLWSPKSDSPYLEIDDSDATCPLIFIDSIKNSNTLEMPGPDYPDAVKGDEMYFLNNPTNIDFNIEILDFKNYCSTDYDVPHYIFIRKWRYR